MIKQSKILLLAAVAAAGFSAPAAFAQTKDVVVDGKGEIPYVIDARNVVARSGTGLCWRTGFWSPAAAATALAGEFPVGCECDGDIVPQDGPPLLPRLPDRLPLLHRLSVRLPTKSSSPPTPCSISTRPC